MAYLEELLEAVGQELRINPYVAQMEKLSESLTYLTKAFRNKMVSGEKNKLEEYNVSMIRNHISEKICKECECIEICELRSQEILYQLIEELFDEIEEYGVELSIRKKRELEKQCVRFEQLKDEVQKSIWTLKNNRMWEVRMVQNQDASLVAMQALVDAIEESTREIDASLFRDERLERKIIIQLKKMEVRTLSVVLFMSEKGKYEVRISAKAKAGVYVTTREIAQVISKVIGRSVMPERKERLVLKEVYTTMAFVERPKFQTIGAVCQQKKQGSEISGDNFLITDVQGGKVCAIISDGMGSGSRAYKKSQMLLELSEKLLESNVSPKLMVQMINAALITETRDLEFATLDMCVVDIYKGEVEIIKAGAASTYIVTSKECQSLCASTLPIGVLVETEVNDYLYEIEEECYIVMVTDGVTDAWKNEDDTTFIYRTISNAKTKNTKELAACILEEALNFQNGVARDDMMVLVLGVWELQF